MSPGCRLEKEGTHSGPRGPGPGSWWVFAPCEAGLSTVARNDVHCFLPVHYGETSAEIRGQAGQEDGADFSESRSGGSVLVHNSFQPGLGAEPGDFNLC